jgi:hypothetical protein
MRDRYLCEVGPAVADLVGHAAPLPFLPFGNHSVADAKGQPVKFYAAS